MEKLLVNPFHSLRFNISNLIIIYKYAIYIIYTFFGQKMMIK